MNPNKMFLEDCAQIAAEKYNKGRIDRRQLLKACAALGLVPVLQSGKAFAATPSQIVHANWGGDAVTCITDIYGAAFEAATGVPALVDGSGPLEGTIKQMVETNSTIWDCCDSDIFSGLRLGRANLLTAIDYSIVDRDKILAPFTYDYAVLGYWYSYALTYDTTKFDGVPTWVDFFDVEKYPGNRTMYKWMNGAPEAALIADGVPLDEVYPLDMDRALEKIDSISDHVIYWGSGAESQTMFLDEEVVMGNIWQTRATVLERDTGGRVTWSWDQAIAYPAAWIIPGNNPAGAEYANRWIAQMQDPELQIAVLDCYGQGPANPAAIDMMTPEQRRLHPAAPENLERQLVADSEYWAEHYDDVLNEFLDAISA
ncbi:MAG: extracellular solute-binding protein [Rhodospirillaceae bacterium]|nr:extracellular solute-binding protein [Rhodospirillaceae bacterium]